MSALEVKPEQGQVINLYTAELDGLKSLPNIGNARAAAIVELRENEELTLDRIAEETKTLPETWEKWMREDLISLEQPHMLEEKETTAVEEVKKVEGIVVKQEVKPEKQEVIREEDTMKAELTAVISVMDQLATSRVQDNLSHQKNLEEMADKMRNLEVEFKYNQKLSLRAVQEKFQRQLNEDRENCWKRSQLLEERVEALHEKLDRILVSMSKHSLYQPMTSTPSLPREERLKVESPRARKEHWEKSDSKQEQEMKVLMEAYQQKMGQNQHTNRSYREPSTESDTENDSSNDSEDSEGNSPHFQEVTRSRKSYRASKDSTENRFRRRSPPPPKMQTFHGEPTKWRSFIFQFEQAANSCRWTDDEKAEKLMACMRDKAIEYLENRPPQMLHNYPRLVKDLKRRYGQRTPARVSRRQLNLVQQAEDEDIDDFSERVHKLAIEGHPGAHSIQSIAVDAFFRGCKDKLAAMIVMGTNPKTLSQAVRRIKNAIQDQRVLGKQSITRQVSFQESPPSTPVKTKNLPDADLAEMITQAVMKAFDSKKIDNPSDRLARSSSPKQCFSCGSRGHFARECPRRSSSQSPVRSPRRDLTCFRCGESGHFARACENPKATPSSPSAPLNA